MPFKVIYGGFDFDDLWLAWPEKWLDLLGSHHRDLGPAFDLKVQTWDLHLCDLVPPLNGETSNWPGAACCSLLQVSFITRTPTPPLSLGPHPLQQSGINISPASCFGTAVILLRGDITMDSRTHFPPLSIIQTWPSLIMYENVLGSLNHAGAV